MRIDQLPLWRLLVALSDAEMVAGPNSPTARALAREITRRMSGSLPDADSNGDKGGINRG